MEKKIHIMHILQTLETGGLENGLVNQINNIDTERYKISVCCLNSSGAMEKRIKNKQTKIIVIGEKPGKAYTLPFKIVAILKKEKVDIVYTHNCYSGIYGGIAARMLFKPLIHGEHGFDYDENSGNIANTKKERFICRIANQITCVSVSLKKIVCENLRVKPSKVIIIPNGVDFERFSNIKNSATIKKDLKIDTDSIVIGSVGRLHHQKNYELLIRSFANLKELYNISMVLVGDGPERKRLHNLASELGVSNRIKFVGERDDIPFLLNLMDIFVLPSFLEGMSNTILEAMCAGCPVVASDVGGNPYIIANEKLGFLFKNNSQIDLSEKMKKLIDDRTLRLHIGLNSKKHVETHYSIDKMIMQYENLYSKHSRGTCNDQ